MLKIHKIPSLQGFCAEIWRDNLKDSHWKVFGEGREGTYDALY